MYKILVDIIFICKNPPIYKELFVIHFTANDFEIERHFYRNNVVQPSPSSTSEVFVLGRHEGCGGSVNSLASH